MITQQEFLRLAMSTLGMTRAQFADRIGCPVATMNKWLLPVDSNQGRVMSEAIWVLVREVLAHEGLKARAGVLSLKRGPRSV